MSLHIPAAKMSVGESAQTATLTRDTCIVLKGFVMQDMATRELDASQLLSAKRVARLLSLSPRTIWRLQSLGVLSKPLFIGGRVLGWIT
jgi:predicted DNA-binding transcriptional regulator AlpA